MKPLPQEAELPQDYKCVSCGYELTTADLSSIRCPKCEYKGLKLVEDWLASTPSEQPNRKDSE